MKPLNEKYFVKTKDLKAVSKTGQPPHMRREKKNLLCPLKNKQKEMSLRRKQDL